MLEFTQVLEDSINPDVLEEPASDVSIAGRHSTRQPSEPWIAPDLCPIVGLDTTASHKTRPFPRFEIEFPTSNAGSVPVHQSSKPWIPYNKRQSPKLELAVNPSEISGDDAQQRFSHLKERMGTYTPDEQEAARALIILSGTPVDDGLEAARILMSMSRAPIDIGSQRPSAQNPIKTEGSTTGKEGQKLDFSNGDKSRSDPIGTSSGVGSSPKLKKRQRQSSSNSVSTRLVQKGAKREIEKAVNMNKRAKV